MTKEKTIMALETVLKGIYRRCEKCGYIPEDEEKIEAIENALRIIRKEGAKV